MNKQIVFILKNCDDDIFEETALDLSEKITWMIVTMLSSNCILAEDAVEFVRNCSISVFDKKTAWMMKNDSISALNEEVIFTLSKQVSKTLRIDKSFNFHYLYWKLNADDSESSSFVTCNK